MTLDRIFFDSTFSGHHRHHKTHHGNHKYYAYRNDNNWDSLSRWSAWGNDRTIIDDVLDRDFYTTRPFNHRNKLFGWDTPFLSNNDRYNYHHKALTYHRFNNDLWGASQYSWAPKTASDLVHEMATSPYLYPPAWTRDSWNNW